MLVGLAFVSLVIAQAAYYRSKYVWQRSAYFDPSAIVRMIKSDFMGVQHEPGNVDAEGASGSHTASFFEFTAIHGIAQNGAANRRGMNANLVRSPSF